MDQQHLSARQFGSNAAYYLASPFYCTHRERLSLTF